MAVTAEKTGKLARVPLTEILASLLARRATGSLILTEPSGQTSVLYISFGMVTKARTRAIVVDDPNPGEITAQHIEWVAERIGTTSFDFCDDLDVMPEVQAVPCLPLAQIWRATRHAAHAARVDRYLARLGTPPIRLHPNARLDLFAFDWDELSCLEPLRHGPLPLAQLLAQPVQDPVVLRRLVYVLVVCRHLDLGDGRGPIGVDGPEARMRHFVPSHPPATRLGTTLPAPPMRSRSGIVHRCSRVASTRPPQPSIHPPRLSPHVPRERSHLASEPVSASQRSERLAARYEFDHALPLAESAARKHGGDPAYAALVAYLRVRCGKFNDRQAEQALNQCHRAVREHPDDNRYRYYRAWVLKAMGQEEDAMRDFAIVVREDPNHIDAARELHLYRQRQSRASSGLLHALQRSLTPTPRRRRPPRL